MVDQSLIRPNQSSLFSSTLTCNMQLAFENKYRFIQQIKIYKHEDTYNGYISIGERSQGSNVQGQ